MEDVIIARKIEMSNRFDGRGRRVPVTLVEAGPCIVSGVKTLEKDKYQAVQIGFGKKKEKHVKKVEKNQYKNLPFVPKTVREFRVDGDLKIGQEIKVGIFEPGDIVKVTSISKGKGFAGVMKRWGFHGGPKTHGQSDRARAPGSIGSTTTPGRVLRGKKMAGHMGNAQVTVKGLKVFEVDEEKNLLLLLGSVPGSRGAILGIVKTGKDKKFTAPKNEEETEVTEEPKESESQSEKELESQSPSPAEPGLADQGSEEVLEAEEGKEEARDEQANDSEEIEGGENAK